MAINCGINYKGRTYSREDFVELMNDPIFAEEVRVNIMTDKFLEFFEGGPNNTTAFDAVTKLQDNGLIGKDIRNEVMKIYREISNRKLNTQRISSSTATNSGVLSFLKDKFDFLNIKLFQGPIKAVNKPVYESQIKANSNIKFHLKQAQRVVNELNNLLDSLGNKIDNQDRLRITDVIQGADPKVLNLSLIKDPEEREAVRRKIIDIARVMRNNIDNLSNSIIKAGYLSEAGVEIFQNNLGKYVTRIYESHVNPDLWWNKLTNTKDPQMQYILNRGKKFIKDSLIRRSNRLKNLKSIAQDEIRQNRIEPANLYEILVSTGEIDPDKMTKKAFKALPKEERQQMFQNSSKAKKEMERREKLLFNRVNSFSDEIGRIDKVLVTDENLVFYIQDMLGIGSEAVGPTTSVSSPIKSDMSIFKKKDTEMPEEIRQLMGEIRDPAAAYAATVQKMVEFQSKYDFQLTFALLGEDVLFSTTPTKEFDTKMSIANLPGLKDTLGSSVKDNTIYVSKDVAEEFTGVMANANWWTVGTSIINTMAKWGATVGNPITQLRNFSSAFTFLLFNGHLFSPSSVKSMSIILSEIKNLAVEGATNKNVRSEFLTEVERAAIQNGVLNSSVDLEEISDLFKKSKLSNIDIDKYGIISHPINGVKGVINFLNTVYAASDNLIKLAGYYAELDRNAPLYGDYKGYNDMRIKAKGGDQQAIEDLKSLEYKAGKIIRETIPNYNESWKINEVIRNKIPFLGVFTSFTTEMIRTQYNGIKNSWDTTKQAFLEEDAKKKKVYSKIALQRLAGIAAMYSLTYYQEDLREIVGQFFGDDEEEEKKYSTLEQRDTFVKYWAPPWVKQIDLRIDSEEDGSFIYSNPGNLNPYALLNNFDLYKRIDSDSKLELVYEYLAPVLSPFLTPELGINQLILLLNNRDENNNKIILSDFFENPIEFTKELSTYIASKSLFAPGILREPFRYWSKYEQTKDLESRLDKMDYDERKAAEAKIKENQENMANSFGAYLNFGYKDTYVNIHNSAKFKVKDLSEKIGDLRLSYSSKTKSDSENYEEHYNDTNTQFQKELTKFRTMIEETRKVLGVDVTEDILEANRKNMSGRMNNEIMDYLMGYTDTAPDISIKDYERRQE